MTIKIKILAGIIIALSQAPIFFLGTSNADAKVSDNTMLMFVGQNLSVVTTASRIPENLGGAPALVRVVSIEEIISRGLSTLGELLAHEPGIYISERASGSIAYMRGVKDGLLLLYNGVPFSTNAIRNAGYLDKEISLHNISRVEIIRGPGSVFWGADAFAGIVNLVPFKGKEKTGSIAEINIDRSNGESFKASCGSLKNDWKFFLSGYVGEDTYHQNSYKVETAITEDDQSFLNNRQNEIEDSRYSEFTGTISKGNWLDISWRLAESHRNYVVNDTQDLSWKGGKKIESNFLKTSLSKKIGTTNLSFSSYYKYYKELSENVDLNRLISDNIFYTEAIIHQPIASDNHLTTGISFRSSSIKGAVLKDNFLPQTLKPTNKIFVPTADQEDFFNDFISVFAQYRHKWGNIDTWIGIRYDDNEGYNSTTSYSFGLNIPVGLMWRLKFAGGTAYRTPYANYFVEDKAFDAESITTLNMEAAWSNPQGLTISFSLFQNLLKDYIYEDPFGGLSDPTDQQITGIEITGETLINRKVKLYGSFTFMETTGDSIPYGSLLYTYVSPDGTSNSVYDEWKNSYDSGPQFMISGGFSWEDSDRFFLSAKTIFTDKIPFAFEKNSKTGFFHSDPVISMEAGIKNFFFKNSRLTLGCKNVFGVSNQVQGTYGPVEVAPTVIYLKYRLCF